MLGWSTIIILVLGFAVIARGAWLLHNKSYDGSPMMILGMTIVFAACVLGVIWVIRAIL